MACPAAAPCDSLAAFRRLVSALEPRERATMADIKWHLKGLNFSHCNCSYGCPCQFNALPSKGNCQAVVGVLVEQGHHGATKLDGLKFGGVFSWPGPIHQGHGEAVP